MIKVNILNFNRFFEVVNQCRDCIFSISEDGRMRNITREYSLQDELEVLYRKNGNRLPLFLKFDNTADFMAVVSYYAGDC